MVFIEDWIVSREEYLAQLNVVRGSPQRKAQAQMELALAVASAKRRIVRQDAH